MAGSCPRAQPSTATRPAAAPKLVAGGRSLMPAPPPVPWPPRLPSTHDDPRACLAGAEEGGGRGAQRNVHPAKRTGSGASLSPQSFSPSANCRLISHLKLHFSCLLEPDQALSSLRHRASSGPLRASNSVPSLRPSLALQAQQLCLVDNPAVRRSAVTLKPLKSLSFLGKFEHGCHDENRHATGCL